MASDLPTPPWCGCPQRYQTQSCRYSSYPGPFPDRASQAAVALAAAFPSTLLLVTGLLRLSLTNPLLFRWKGQNCNREFLNLSLWQLCRHVLQTELAVDFSLTFDSPSAATGPAERGKLGWDLLSVTHPTPEAAALRNRCCSSQASALAYPAGHLPSYPPQGRDSQGADAQPRGLSPPPLHMDAPRAPGPTAGTLGEENACREVGQVPGEDSGPGRPHRKELVWGTQQYLRGDWRVPRSSAASPHAKRDGSGIRNAV
nr:uncharacterized protein LOC112994938 [Dromaius novaehollandiae]